MTSSPLADALAAAAAECRTGGPRCTAATVLDTLTDADRAALIAALADRSITVTVIVNALTQTTGKKPSRSGLERHRRGECACPT